MRFLKKDWMFDAKIILGVIIGILTAVAFLIVILVKIANRMPVDNGIEIYNKIYSLMILILSFYPILAFKGVCPEMGSDKVYLKTANLPMSRKQVFLYGLKPWFIIYPLVIIVGGIISLILGTGTKGFEYVFLSSLAMPILVLPFGGVIQLQIMTAYIFTLAKKIKGYKVVEAIILFNVVLVGLCIIGINVFNVDTAHDPWWMFGCGAFIFIANFIMFLIAWRDIEKVYQ